MWIYTILTYNFIHFPMELLICETAFAVQKQERGSFGIRVILSLCLYFVLAFGWDRLINEVLGDTQAAVILLYLGYAVLTAAPLVCCFEINRMELIFTIVGGYAVQHMCFSALRIILYFVKGSLYVHGAELIVTQYLVYLLWAAMIYILFIRKSHNKNDFDVEDVRMIVFALVLTFVAIVFSAFYSDPDDTLTIYNGILCPAYGVVCCAMILVMEYDVLRENRMKREQELMEEMLRMANGQQRSTKDAIDIINIKCHDLKHQIRALAKIEDADARSEYLQEVQRAVSIYDATYHTGCKALDYILREKSLMFDEYGVEFSCMVEGETVAFMSVPDIYALMGNALDNALECVKQEAEDERMISLQIRRNGDMVLLHLENRCSRKPEFRDGFPVTNKKDKTRHGFGVKSIRYIVEKYGGELFMDAKCGKFSLDILFSRPVI